MAYHKRVFTYWQIRTAIEFLESLDREQPRAVQIVVRGLDPRSEWPACDLCHHIEQVSQVGRWGLCAKCIEHDPTLKSLACVVIGPFPYDRMESRVAQWLVTRAETTTRQAVADARFNLACLALELGIVRWQGLREKQKEGVGT